MSSTIRIATSELRSLFVSPIAWVVLVVFMLHSATLYIDRLDQYAVLEFTRGNDQRALSQIIFTDGRNGVATQLLPYLLLYVPLLTMGVFARDLHTGAMKLLLSSPVRLMSIVIGKYLAIAAYFSLFTVVLGVLLFGTGFIVENVDYAHVLTAVFGLFLLMCAYAAVGVFISSFSANQVVTAMATLAALGVLDMLWRVGQDWPVIGQVAYWLSISGRAEYFVQGLITTKDLFYFLLVITLFLGLTFLRFDAGRKTEHAAMLAGRIASLCAMIFALGLASSVPGWIGYADMTRRAQNTLTPVSQGLVDQVPGALQVTAYVNVLDGHVRRYRASSRRDLTRTLFDRYARFNPELRVEFVLYYGPPQNRRLLENNPGKSLEALAREWARDNGVPFRQIRSYEALDAAFDLAAENYRPLYVLEWQNQTSIVRTFDDPVHHPGEREISHTLFRMTHEPALVSYYTGSGARSALQRGPNNHRVTMADPNARMALINNGFDIAEFGAEDPVPAGTDILVIAGPQTRLPEQALSALQDHITRGGDMILMAEPGSETSLGPIFETLGIEQLSGDTRRTTDLDLGLPIQDTTVFAETTEDGVRLGLGRAAGASSAFGSLALETPSLLRLREIKLDNGFVTTPVLQPVPGSISFNSVPMSEEVYFGFVAERVVDTREQRIYVLGDADAFATFMTNTGSLYSHQNTQAFDQVIGWLTRGRLPLDMSRPAPIDDKLHLTIRAVDHVRLLLFVILPGLLGAFGYSVLSRRKRA